MCYYHKKVIHFSPNRLMSFRSMSLSNNGPVAASTVLCIDDEASLLHLQRRYLESHGYTVLTAATGQEGLEILSAAPVDVVVLDYLMPAMDGFAVALEIRPVDESLFDAVQAVFGTRGQPARCQCQGYRMGWYAQRSDDVPGRRELLRDQVAEGHGPRRAVVRYEF